MQTKANCENVKLDYEQPGSKYPNVTLPKARLPRKLLNRRG